MAQDKSKASDAPEEREEEDEILVLDESGGFGIEAANGVRPPVVDLDGEEKEEVEEAARAAGRCCNTFR